MNEFSDSLKKRIDEIKSEIEAKLIAKLREESPKVGKWNISRITAQMMERDLVSLQERPRDDRIQEIQ